MIFSANKLCLGPQLSPTKVDLPKKKLGPKKKSKYYQNSKIPKLFVFVFVSIS